MLFDEGDFPSSLPIFQLLFACNCGIDIRCFFEVDEAVHLIFGSETGNGIVFVLGYPMHEIIGDADIERAVTFARKDIDIIGFHV